MTPMSESSVHKPRYTVVRYAFVDCTCGWTAQAPTLGAVQVAFAGHVVALRKDKA